MPVTTLDGTIRQSAHYKNLSDYGYTGMNVLVLGVVVNLFPSDHKENKSAASRPSQRGSRWEATVVAINDGFDTPWIIPNVTIIPPGASGVDNFHEELPRPSTGTIDGSAFKPSLERVDVDKLNGDWCLVQFVGGEISQPVMTHWFPHPGNRLDTATSGELLSEAETTGKNSTLAQNRRLFKRYNGTQFVVSPQGSVYLRTHEANTQIIGNDDGVNREEKEGGGDVNVDIKNSASLEINFNDPVNLPETKPYLPQKNPPSDPVFDEERANEATKVLADKESFGIWIDETRITVGPETIRAVAKEMVKLMSESDIEMEAETINSVADTIKEESSNILMGSQPDALIPDDGVVTGRGVDPFTGKTYFQLLNTSLKVKAEK